MSTPPNSPLAEPLATAPLCLNLASLDAALLARLVLQPPAKLLVDCSVQPCWHSLGVCHFLSQLLLLRQCGVSVWLCKVDPLLRHCLQQLGLHDSFFLAE